jgi:hypothetical protein
VRERRTSNFAVVKFYGYDWLALIDNMGTKSSGLRDRSYFFISLVEVGLVKLIILLATLIVGGNKKEEGK